MITYKNGHYLNTITLSETSEKINIVNFSNNNTWQMNHHPDGELKPMKTLLLKTQQRSCILFVNSFTHTISLFLYITVNPKTLLPIH